MQESRVASGRRLADAAFAIGAIALYGYLAFVSSGMLSKAWAFSGDDAFIAFQYARHLAEGVGLRFNLTDPQPTEGYSSLLHVLALAASFKLGGEPLIATRFLALLSFLAIPLALAFPVSRLCSVSFPVALFASATIHLLFLLQTSTSLHLAFGLETWMFSLAVAALAGWMMLELSDGVTTRMRVAWGVAAVSFVLLARPEGTVLVAAAIAFVALALFCRSSITEVLKNRPLFMVAACAIAECAALLAWKAAYFGHVVPNPYYVKAHNAIFGSDGSLLPGLAYTYVFFKRFGLVLLAGTVPLAFVPAFRRRAGAALWVLGPALGIVLLYSRAIHEMAFGHRYEYPYLVAVEVVLVCAVCCAHTWNRCAPVAVALALLFGVQFRPVRAYASDTLFWTKTTSYDLNLAHCRLGQDLGRTGLGNEATILLSGAGAVPYFSEMRCVDWIGLNTTYLSGREALTMDQVWSYIDGTKPDVIYSILPPASATEPKDDPTLQSIPLRALLSGWSSDLFLHWNRDRLFDMAYREMCYVRDGYTFGACYKLGADPIWLIAYVRKDSPHRDRILATFADSPFADRTSNLKESYINDPRVH